MPLGNIDSTTDESVHALVARAFEGIDPSRVCDNHCHVLGAVCVLSCVATVWGKCGQLWQLWGKYYSTVGPASGAVVHCGSVLLRAQFPMIRLAL
jgi:hypothetical protein